ncbi:hypothetical protein NL108_002830 [Boleophthalmus pectinirostris]|nr:hypothetical protein NL108_002830 [Boleophthalmus pectinirostris]
MRYIYSIMRVFIGKNCFKTCILTLSGVASSQISPVNCPGVVSCFFLSRLNRLTKAAFTEEKKKQIKTEQKTDKDIHTTHRQHSYYTVQDPKVYIHRSDFIITTPIFVNEWGKKKQLYV